MLGKHAIKKSLRMEHELPRDQIMDERKKYFKISCGK